MKLRRIRKSAAAKLVAAGLALPSASLAAPLNTNLVNNPSFENVDPGETGPFGAVRLLDWEDVDGDVDDTWAYAYSQAYSGTVPPPGSGAYHYSGAFNTVPGVADVLQYVDVSDGPSAAAIGSGLARYDMSAYFSTYLDQNDSTFFRVRFLDNSLNDVGVSEQIGGYGFISTLGFAPGPFGDQRDWGKASASGDVPAGTSFLLVELLSEDADANHDGYVDLVDFQISVVPEPSSIMLAVLAGAPLLFVGARGVRRRLR